ncbi:hypothetical protein CPY51_30490 [Rhizobium tubonense]|uniref:Uncharacterized protein n=1 Tax=Rhizobium tubonense TaxID=484088 RepID=A0A2W4CRM2_9HYPH|nr:hypothetical protein CPY51_30490 [Rhizobium tubonense]
MSSNKRLTLGLMFTRSWRRTFFGLGIPIALAMLLPISVVALGELPIPALIFLLFVVMILTAFGTAVYFFQKGISSIFREVVCIPRE